MPAVWGLGKQDPGNEERHAIQLEMETTQMPGLQNDLRDLRDPDDRNRGNRTDQPGRQARAVDVVQSSLQAVITAKQRLGGYNQDIKTLQEAIDLWNSRR